MKRTHAPIRNRGFFGIGATKPSPRAWQPHVNHVDAPEEPVPEKYRSLRIRKTKMSKVSKTPLYEALPVAFVLVAFVVCAIALIYRIASLGN